MRTCSKCLKHIDESREEYVMLIGKKAGKIKEFFVFHKRCWLGHWGEYWEMEKKRG